jgi:hypothetical protein
MDSENEIAIYYFRMNNGDDVIGEMLYADMDVMGNKTYYISDPMRIEYKEVNGALAMALNRYFAFSEHNYVEFKEKDITSVTKVSKLFEDYYNNSVKYNYLYVDKSIQNGIKEMNSMIATSVSNENKLFVDAMKKYNIDPDSFLDQLPN